MYRYGMVWYGMVWSGMVWYGIICLPVNAISTVEGRRVFSIVRNKVKILDNRSVFCWFVLYHYITMHGTKNIKL
jgi:hypothetical protein